MSKHFFKLLFGALFLVSATAFTGCNDDDKEPTPVLTASPEVLNFTDETSTTQTIEIKANCHWEVSASALQGWATITPMEGNGNATLTVAVEELPAGTNSREGVISFNLTHSTYGKWGLAESKVKVTQTSGNVPTPPVGDALYSENAGDATFKKADYEGNWPYVDKYDKWTRGGSLDQSGVVYGGSSSSVRCSGNDYEPDASDDISGAPYVNVKTFDIKNINIGSNSNFTFTFVAQNTVSTLPDSPYTPTFGDITASSFNFSVSMDGTNYSKVAYVPVKSNSSWYKCTAEFKLPAGASASTISVRIDGFSGGTTLRTDDFNLYEGGNGAELGGGGEPGPGPGDAVKITIPELIAKCEAAGDSQTVIDPANDVYFEAVVLTNKAGGNTTTNNLALMTEGATSPKNGILLYGSGIYTNPADDGFVFAAGDKVKVTLKANAARCLTYNSLYEITGSQGADWVLVEKTGETAAITPIEISIGDLMDYQSMYVKINNVTAPATAAAWCTADASGTHNFSVGGSNLTVYVQKNAAAFVDQVFMAGVTGSIIGNVALYRGAAQITPQTIADVAAFMEGGDVPAEPKISSVSPTSLSFAATGEAKEVNVTLNSAAQGLAIEASSDNGQFAASVNGTTVTVTAAENATAAAITGTLTISLMQNGSAIDTKTVALTQAAKSSGGGTETVTMSFAEIKAGNTTGADMPVNSYGSQAVADPSTWYTWSHGGLDFSGAKICEASNTNYVGTLQMQGNTSDAAKQGFFGNVTDLGKITKIVVVSKNTTYSPTEHLYMGTEANPSGNAQTSTIVQDGEIYTETFDIVGDYGFFKLHNDKQGAFYVQSISITYTK